MEKKHGVLLILRDTKLATKIRKSTLLLKMCWGMGKILFLYIILFCKSCFYINNFRLGYELSIKIYKFIITSSDLKLLLK